VVLVLVALAAADNWFNSGVNSAYKCSGPRVRRSWNDATPEQKQCFVRLVYQAKLVKGAFTTGSTSQSALFDVFPNIHKSSGNAIWHYTSCFIAAHKGFLHMYEQMLTYVALKYGPTMDPPILPEDACECSTLKYWAWECDYDTTGTTDNIIPVLQSSPIWDTPGGCKTCFGDATYDPNGYYVNTGLFTKGNNWKLVSAVSGDVKQWQSSAAPYYDNYLKRVLDPKEIRLDPSQIMNTIRNNPGFSTMLPYNHGAAHSCIHLFLGFSMKTQASPDEPLFFMHHCNVDRIFHLWADCWEYDAIDANNWTDLQYVEINPTPGGTAVEEMISGSTKQKVRVLADTVVPYKMGSGSAVFIPPEKWPKIRDLWTCGEEGKPGWLDMYVRYGYDKMAEFMDKNGYCVKDQKWRWVHYNANQKRGETTPEIEDNETKMYRQLEESLRYKREQEGLSPDTALRQLAMENCLLNPSEKMTPQKLDYLRMMGIAPSSLDRICDEPSQDPGFSGHSMHM
jgi:hypothetical protein